MAYRCLPLPDMRHVGWTCLFVSFPGGCRPIVKRASASQESPQIESRWPSGQSRVGPCPNMCSTLAKSCMFGPCTSCFPWPQACSSCAVHVERDTTCESSCERSGLRFKAHCCSSSLEMSGRLLCEQHLSSSLQGSMPMEWHLCSASLHQRLPHGTWTGRPRAEAAMGRLGQDCASVSMSTSWQCTERHRCRTDDDTWSGRLVQHTHCTSCQLLVGQSSTRLDWSRFTFVLRCLLAKGLYRRVPGHRSPRTTYPEVSGTYRRSARSLSSTWREGMYHHEAPVQWQQPCYGYT